MVIRPAGAAGFRARLRLTLGSFQLEVDLTISGGETLVLLGPNGSGKSTCLDLIAGLRRPDAGSIVLGGRVLCDTDSGIDLSPDERRVGLVFQDYALFPHGSVRRNVDYGPRARRMPKAERERIVAGELMRFDLTELKDRPAMTLSGGERQRVALARALASGAEILLLDEPFASLDATRRVRVRADLRRFLGAASLPALVVTHDPIDAAIVGDRLAILEEGRIVQTGTVAEISAHPNTPFVADLVGLNWGE